MEKMLLWFEIAAALLLVHATLSAGIARFLPPEFHWLLYLMLCAPGVVAFALLLTFVAHWRFDLGATHFPFFYFASLAAVYLVGISAVGWKGIRIRGEAERPPAVRWPLTKLAAAAGVAVVFQSTTLSIMDLAARERISRLKAEAAAMSLSVAPIRPADSDNAAPIYSQAIENLRQDDSTKLATWMEVAAGEKPLDVKDPALRAYLQRHEADITLLRNAAARSRWYFDRQYGRPRVDILLPETQDTRFVVVLLSLHARVCAADGDTATAAKDVAAMFATSRHVTEEPFFVSELIAAAEFRLAIDTLVDVLNSAKMSEQQLAAFRIPDNVSFRQVLRRNLIFEEAMAVGGSVEMLADPLPGDSGEMFASANFSLGPGGAVGRPDVLGQPLPLSPRVRNLLSLYRVFLLSAEVSRLRNGFQSIRNAISSASPAVLGSYSRSREECKKIQDEMQSKSSGLLPPLVWPAVESLAHGVQVAETRTDIARIALAAARFRAKNGKYPASVTALVPQFISAVPIDAFSERPIQLEVSNKGWTLFSVGRDSQGKRIELTLH
jgi:hypothetical protein